MQKMPDISNFVSSADHFHITEYTLEYCLCDNQGCIVCAKIGRGIRTPNISINGNNIRGKLLRWMNLPLIEPLSKSYFLSVNKTRAYIDTTISSQEKIMINLPTVKGGTIIKKNIAKGKYKDKVQSFDRSEVRMKLICDACNYHQCVYSNKNVWSEGWLEKF